MKLGRVQISHSYIVDLDNKDEALSILPPVYRNEAKITELKQYKLEDFAKSDKVRHNKK